MYGASVELVGHGEPGASSSSKKVEHEQSMSVVGIHEVISAMVEAHGSQRLPYKLHYGPLEGK